MCHSSLMAGKIKVRVGGGEFEVTPGPLQISQSYETVSKTNQQWFPGKRSSTDLRELTTHQLVFSKLC